MGEKGLKLIVRKANDLVEAKSSLTVAERKAMAVAIAFIKGLDGSQAVAEIEFETLKKVLEKDGEIKVDRDFRKELRKVLHRLKSKKELALIEIPKKNLVVWLRENGKEEWIERLGLAESEKGYVICGVIDDISVSPDKGKIEIRFNRFITPLVLELKRRYTTYELKYIMLLDRKHSTALYELFKKNEKLGKFKIEFSRLREILGVADKPTYKVWNDFWKKILKPSIEEINEKTDIEVKVETQKGAYGRVEALVFTIKNKRKHHSSILEVVKQLAEDKALEVSPKELAEVLLSLERLNPATALWFMLHYPEGEPRLYAWEHIKMTEQNAKIKYPDRYLESLIRDKDESLDWLLDQRTKDTIKEELKKLVEKGEKGEKPQTDREMEKLLNRLEEIKPLVRLYYDQIAQYFGTDNLREFLNDLIEKGDKERLEEFIAFVETLEKAPSLN